MKRTESSAICVCVRREVSEGMSMCCLCLCLLVWKSAFGLELEVRKEGAPAVYVGGRERC